MKRPKPAKRRDRSTGQSPYVRHRKREYLYSQRYREWKKDTVRENGSKLVGGRIAGGRYAVAGDE